MQSTCLCRPSSVLLKAQLLMLPFWKGPVLSGCMHVRRAAKEKDHLAGHREREAGKLGDLHARKQQGLSPIEAELENLRRCCRRLSHPWVAWNEPAEFYHLTSACSDTRRCQHLTKRLLQPCLHGLPRSVVTLWAQTVQGWLQTWGCTEKSI